MATDAIVTLEQLHCMGETDVSGHSEPYLWSALLWIDDNTITTPELVGVVTPAESFARVVIKDNMRAGQNADIPTSVGVLRVRFEDGLSVRRLILAVALWEEDETPDDAMRAGYGAFSSELRAAIADNLFALSQANEEEIKALTETIKARVKSKVRSAIEDGLTGWQKVRVFLGTLNLDDIIDSDFVNFGELESMPIRMSFKSGTTEEYHISGNLSMRPVTVDRCQAQVDAVKAAQTIVDGIDSEIKQLQVELGRASPAEKRFIIAEIRRIRREELPTAAAELEAARRALQACRNRTPPLVTTGGVFTEVAG